MSHTSDLSEFPKDRSFVAAAQAAVIRAGHAVTDMAYFTARDHEPAHYCEEMVADASVYVGIVGVRYGMPVRGRLDRSFTELEYEVATKLGLPRLIFLTRDDSASMPAADQPADQAVRQQAFRQRLLHESNATVAWVTTPTDLEISLFHALVELERELSRPKNRLEELRRRLMLSQEEAAERMGVSTSTYQNWEEGKRLPRPHNMRTLCEAFGVEQAALGFGQQSGTEPEIVVAGTLDRSPSAPTHAPTAPWATLPEAPAAIRASQDEWRQARRRLAAQAAALTRLAAELYPHAMKVGSTPLLTRADWMAGDPLDLNDLQLDWLDGPQRKIVHGTEPEARLLFPLRAPGHQFESYTSAVRYLDRPTLFDNRPTYRLLEASMQDTAPILRFSLATYFEMIDVSQAVAHELVVTELRAGPRVSLDQLPFRSLIGDPFDIRRRPVQAAINAVTLRRDTQSGTASFLLHWRDPAKVAVGGGMYSVMPVGVFQPSTVDPWGQRLDFDPWRNLVREFSEEFLGMPEHDGSAGARIDYDMWPLYRTLTRARDAGSVRVRCFGLGVDPLGTRHRSVDRVVIDSDVFDDVFGDRVQVNAEGHVVSSETPSTTVGFPFTEDSVHRFVHIEPMGPGGAACLSLAWEHREALL